MNGNLKKACLKQYAIKREFQFLTGTKQAQTGKRVIKVCERCEQQMPISSNITQKQHYDTSIDWTNEMYIRITNVTI